MDDMDEGKPQLVLSLSNEGEKPEERSEPGFVGLTDWQD
jgi:hypothetical protein